MGCFVAEERYSAELKRFHEASPPKPRSWEDRPLVLDAEGYREAKDHRDQPYYDLFWERYMAEQGTHRKKRSQNGGGTRKSVTQD